MKCRISHPTAVLNHADANGNTTLASGVFDGGLSTKTVDFEVISADNTSQYQMSMKLRLLMIRIHTDTHLDHKIYF